MLQKEQATPQSRRVILPDNQLFDQLLFLRLNHIGKGKGKKKHGITFLIKYFTAFQKLLLYGNLLLAFPLPH